MKIRHVLGLATLGVLARAVTKRLRAYDFRERTVLITGGSRGLGLVLARELASEGARLVLLARDVEELAAARDDLSQIDGADVTTIVCDVTHAASIEAAVERVLRSHGRVDVLVNNAGIIQIGPAEGMTLEDYEQSMATHFWGALHAMNAVLPSMRKHGGGRIVNIASVGGVVAVPHLAPYCASKFALVGLSDALRAELAKHGVRITTVCPGLMRTGSHVNVTVKGRHAQEFAWFSASAAAPFVSMDAQRAAKQIVRACRDGDPALHIGLPARALIAANAVAPSALGTAMKAVDRLLPREPRAESEEAQSGWESRSRMMPSILTRLADRASARNNELIGHREARP